jgi:iron complex outermembrane receptor protein
MVARRPCPLRRKDQGISMKLSCSARRLRAGATSTTSLAAVAALMTGAVALQSSAHAAEPAPASGEVVITGALRTQRLQDAPMAVTAVDPQQFTNSGFKEPRDLQFLSSSVQVSIQGANAIYIRGSGTNSQNGGTEQSVGLVIDGVLMGFVDDIGGDISDLDHVEVYRGPQGTQFAKNASAGVVSIITNRPRIGDFALITHATFGEHTDSSNYATVNVPINDQWAARFTASLQHRDGVYDNIVLHQKQGSRQQVGFRGKLLFRPNQDLSVYFSGDVRRATESPNFPQAWGFCGPPGPTTPYVNVYGTKNLPPCNGALTVGITPSDTNSIIVERDSAFRTTDSGGASAQADWMLSGFTVTSISAYRFMTRQFHGPSGSGVYANQFLNNDYSGYQISQELRLLSPSEGRLTYVAGMFLYKRDTHTRSLGAGPAYGQAFFLYPNTQYGRDVYVSSAGGTVDSHNINKSIAGYIDGTLHLIEGLQVNAGFRVTHDDVSATAVTTAVAGVYPLTVGGALKPPGALSTPKTGYTWRVGPQYFVNPNLQLYFTYAHGYKGPLIDTSVNTLTAILPEEVNMLEAGIKSSWFENRLTLNVTGFHQKFTNYQVNVLNTSIIPNSFQLGNAGGMLSKGVELDVTARPVDSLKLSGGLTLNDSHYTDFKTPCWNGAEPIKQATSGINGCFKHGSDTAASANAAGTPLVNSSKWTYRISATYTRDLPNGYELDITANWFHRSSWLSAPMDPNIINPGYGVLSLNGGVSSQGGRYRIGIFARNALNTFFLAGRQANNGGWTNVLNPEAVRTVGVSLDMRLQP